jgi:Family of unknown function (DUF5372)
VQTAHQPKNLLGWVTITHPFHPLRGQKFEVLFSRSLPGNKIFSLKKPSGGTFAVPHEWTDQESLSPECTILSVYSLLELAKLMKQLKKEVDK